MLKLNCDLGEGVGNEERIMPLIDQANIACGAHAGSEEEMRRCVELAAEHGVEIGAHPGYPDREHFGRRSMDLSPSALRETLEEQIGRLAQIAAEAGLRLRYVKPHGALYNDMMADPELLDRIAGTVASIDPNLRLMLLSTADHEEHARLLEAHGITPIYELFADRHYTEEGRLVPRSEANAVIHDPGRIRERILRFRETGALHSREGTPLRLRGDSLCVHGDNPRALALIEILHRELKGG
ncbi:5-oxoprolinase subunit PxpA [Nitratifractor sp.]